MGRRTAPAEACRPATRRRERCRTPFPTVSIRMTRSTYDRNLLYGYDIVGIVRPPKPQVLDKTLAVELFLRCRSHIENYDLINGTSTLQPERSAPCLSLATLVTLSPFRLRVAPQFRRASKRPVAART